MPGDGLQPLRDLDNVRGFLSGQGPTALFDLPWMPLYLGICFLFHFSIRFTALVGAIVLVSLAVITDALSRGPTRAAIQHGMARNALMEAGRRNAEVVHAMGLGGRVAERWQQANTDYLAANRRTGDTPAASAACPVAAHDPAIGHAGGRRLSRHQAGDERGVMIASSIMMGRALAPVDLAIASWKPFLMARQSWGRLKELFALIPETRAIMALPKPGARVARGSDQHRAPQREETHPYRRQFCGCRREVRLASSARAAVGKSTLARALVGVWAPASGKVRIDGAGLRSVGPGRAG